jgi:hypothetical protein
MPSAARVAKNESVFREVNERIRELEEGFGEKAGEYASFVCECSRLSCRSAVDASLDEYRRVRDGGPRHFLVLPDHVDADHERIVSTTERFAVVEKFGTAGEVAEEEDA